MVDGVIVSGRTTGRLIELEALKSASKAARALKIPIILGSGASLATLAEIKPWLDGMIVGSALRQGGQAGAPLDAKKVREFAREFMKLDRAKAGKKRKTVRKK
jgi:predicted TIM-barrel enzyme